MTDIKFIGTNQVELVNSLSGTTISPASSGENFIEFSFNTLSKNNKDYYHFVITGSNVEVSGTIDSVTTKHQFVNLFKDQTAITTASGLQLTAPTMKEFCYSNMFLNCTSLKTPPSALPACNLDAWCYAGMFAGCTNLSSMEVEFTNYDNSNNAFTNWVSGVVAAGTFTKPASLTNMPVGNNGIPTNWTVVNK